MINLLPDDYKAEIKAGRLNVIFLNYIIMTFFAISLITVLTGLAFVTLSSAQQNAQNRMTEKMEEIEKYNTVAQAAKDYRADLSTAKQILDKSIDYSSLIIRIANITPRGVVFTDLNLDSKTLGTPTTISVRAVTRNDVLNLKTAMQEHTELFSDVSLQQIQTEAQSIGGYWYTAKLTATIKKTALTDENK